MKIPLARPTDITLSHSDWHNLPGSDKLGQDGGHIAVMAPQKVGGDVLGSGDPQLEQRISEIAARHANFLFLCGFFEPLAQLLYRIGDLFLMPSSFEPCGISQMLAMRTGQPCIAHAVGGLKDTIQHNVTGLLFDGDTPAAQADNFVANTLHARQLKTDSPEQWQSMRKLAAAERFSWEVAAEQYEKELYESSGS